MKKLERRLGLGQVISISISAMLGSGIFVLPGLAISLTGSSVWIAYLLAGLSVLPAAISKSELATAMPTSGGTYVYIERTFGPMAGTIAGLGLWLSLLLKAAFALVGFGAYLSIIAPSANTQIVSNVILVLIVLLNLMGVGKVSNILVFVVSVSVALLLSLGSAGLVFNFNPEHFVNLFPAGSEGLMSATALVFVAFAGVTKVAAIAEEIKDPERNLPRGILFSLAIVTFLYCSITFVLVAVVPYDALALNLRPIYDLAVAVAGPSIGMFTAVVAVLTMSSMANSGILAASRFPFAMGRDRLLPSKIGSIHRRFLTPHYSIMASGVIVFLAITLLDVGKIAKLASVFILLIYMIENIAVIILRETRVQWYKPSYKGKWYPFVQIFGILTTVALLFGMGYKIVLPAIISVFTPGLLLYVFYSRKRVDRRGVIGIRGKRNDLVQEIQEITPRSRLQGMDFSVDANVVVTLFGKERSPEMLIEMGVTLAEHSRLEVAHVTEVPEQTDLDDISEEPAELRSLRRRVVAMAVEKKEPITFDPVVSHDISKTIFDISQRLHCHWLLIEWRGKTRGFVTAHNPMGWLKGHLRCNLGIFRDSGVRYIRKIMVFLQGDANDELCIDTAIHLADVNKADISIYKCLPASSNEMNEKRERLKIEELTTKFDKKMNIEILKTEEPIESIISQTAEYDLFVFGSAKFTFWQSFRGTNDDKLMAKTACSVISVQSSTAFDD